VLSSSEFYDVWSVVSVAQPLGGPAPAISPRLACPGPLVATVGGTISVPPPTSAGHLYSQSSPAVSSALVVRRCCATHFALLHLVVEMLPLPAAAALGACRFNLGLALIDRFVPKV
jgi:hypothetical protein